MVYISIEKEGKQTGSIEEIEYSFFQYFDPDELHKAYSKLDKTLLDRSEGKVRGEPAYIQVTDFLSEEQPIDFKVRDILNYLGFDSSELNPGKDDLENERRYLTSAIRILEELELFDDVWNIGTYWNGNRKDGVKIDSEEWNMIQMDMIEYSPKAHREQREE